MARRRIVEVVWDDHAFYIGDYNGGDFALQRSVGFVVRESSRWIKLAQSYQKPDKKFMEVLVIDKRTVRSIREVS